MSCFFVWSGHLLPTRRRLPPGEVRLEIHAAEGSLLITRNAMAILRAWAVAKQRKACIGRE